MRAARLHLLHHGPDVHVYQDGTAAEALALDAALFGGPAPVIETREATALPFDAHGYREALSILAAPGPGRSWSLSIARGPFADVWVCEVVGPGWTVRGVGHVDWLAMGLAVGVVRERWAANAPKSG